MVLQTMGQDFEILPAYQVLLASSSVGRCAKLLISMSVVRAHPSQPFLDSLLVQWENSRLIIDKHWIVTSTDYQGIL